jgi:hypothetical protein
MASAKAWTTPDGQYVEVHTNSSLRSQMLKSLFNELNGPADIEQRLLVLQKVHDVVIVSTCKVVLSLTNCRSLIVF